MSEHDDLDQAIRERLRSAAPSVPARDDLAELRPRFERARRRRLAGISVASAAAAVLVAVAVMFVGGGGRDGETVDVAGDRSTSVSSSTAAVPPNTSDSSSTTTPASTSSSTPSSSAAPATSLPTTTAATAPGGTAGPTPSNPTTTVTTVPVGWEQAVKSAGGEARARWTASSLVVDHIAPGVGWATASVEQKSPTRVVIHFVADGGSSGSGSGEDTVDIRVVDGQLEVN